MLLARTLSPFTLDRDNSILFFDPVSFGLAPIVIVHIILLSILGIILPLVLRPLNERRLAIGALSWVMACLYCIWLIFVSLSVSRHEATFSALVIGAVILLEGMIWARPWRNFSEHGSMPVQSKRESNEYERKI